MHTFSLVSEDVVGSPVIFIQQDWLVRCSRAHWSPPCHSPPPINRPVALIGWARRREAGVRACPERNTPLCRRRAASRRQAANRRRSRATHATLSRRTAAGWKVTTLIRCSQVSDSVSFPKYFTFRLCVSPPDVPAWLKSLRLHKYASLFSQMTYEEMMILTEQHLESQVSSTLIGSCDPSPTHHTFTLVHEWSCWI